MTFDSRGRYNRQAYQCPGRERGLHHWVDHRIVIKYGIEMIVARCEYCNTEKVVYKGGRRIKLTEGGGEI
jgi:hypothetical protein